VTLKEGFRLGDWDVLPLAGRISRDGHTERLRPKAMDVLCRLAASAGEVVERDTILSEVWGRTAVSDEPLTATVGELRRLLGDRREQPFYIETIPKRGYRLVAAVTPLDAGTLAAAVGDAGGLSTTPAPPAAGTASAAGFARSRRRLLLWAGALLLLLGGLLLWQRPPGEARVAEALPTSLAVLPFAVLGNEQDDRYFGDGLAREILTTLSGIGGLRVAARSSAFQFRDRRNELAALRESLGVDAVLDGSIRREGTAVRIQVHLVDTRSGFNLWADTYDRQLDDAFAVQSDIARQIAGRLSVPLADTTSRGSRGTSAAYLDYLRGRYLFDTARVESQYFDARDRLEAAVAADPEFSLARATLAALSLRLSDLAYLAPSEGYEFGREQALRALQTDPDLAEAHWVLGWIKLHYDWDWAGANASLSRALALQPGNADFIAAAATLNYYLAQFDDAIALASMGAERDPLRAGSFYNLAFFSFGAGRLDISEQGLASAVELAPDFPGAGLLQALIHLQRGLPDAAATAAAGEGHPALLLMGRALVAHDTDDMETAERALRELEETFGDALAYQIAEVHAAFGNVDEAFQWLTKALNLRDAGIAEIQVDPLLQPLRGDPRYERLVRKVGFLPPAERG
jgi:TolB-like protein/DNA-binding winged helix-turn-helix (wHTH) protein/Tfp pilus assembly protein PilF